MCLQMRKIHLCLALCVSHFMRAQVGQMLVCLWRHWVCGLTAIRSHRKMRLQMQRRLCNQATLLLECPGKVVSNFRPFRLELFSPGACVRIWHRHPNVNFLESARRPDDTERRGELGGARSSRRVGAHRQKTPHSDLSLLVCCGGHVGACVARPTQDR